MSRISSTAFMSRSPTRRWSSAAARRSSAIRRNQEIAACLGFNDAIDETQVRDLLVIGAGPAGLAAAVYAASEGLDVLVSNPTPPAARRDRAPRSRTTSDSPRASQARSSRAAPTRKPRSSARRSSSRRARRGSCAIARRTWSRWTPARASPPASSSSPPARNTGGCPSRTYRPLRRLRRLLQRHRGRSAVVPRR